MALQIIDIDNNNPSGNQSINIPADLKIDDDRVFIKKTGNVIHIIPYHNPWDSLYSSLNEFTDDFKHERDQGIVQSRELFD